MFVIYNLDGANDDPEFGGFLKFGGEPLPLDLTKDSGFGTGLGYVDFSFSFLHFD